MPPTNLSVTMLTMTPDAEELIYSAMRQCYSDEDAAAIFDQATFDINTEDGCNKIYALINKVMESGHESPIEHVSFSFAISGVSRALSHQLVRHRIASYSQQSQRYVKADDFDYVVPLSIVKAKSSVAVDWEEGLPKIFDAESIYIRAIEDINYAYNTLIELGVPAEDARFVLPNACATKLVVTMNCRALLHFFEERCCQRAQWEIRALANAMLTICKERLPVVFENAGPKCVRLGYCEEHKSCGRYPKREGK